MKIASKDRSARQTERQDLRVTDREITAETIETAATDRAETAAAEDRATDKEIFAETAATDRAAIAAAEAPATDREITAGIVVMGSRAAKAEDRRAAEAARAKAVRAEAPVRAAVVTSGRHFPRWKRNRRRRMSKNAFIRIKKETNSPSWITAAARARRIKRESNSVPWRSRQNRRSTTDRSRS